MSVRATLVGILNKFGVEISPATEDKQDDIITAINASSTGSATEAKQDVIISKQLPDNHQVTVSNPTANPETGLAKDATLGSILTELAQKLEAGQSIDVGNFPTEQATRETSLSTIKTTAITLTDANTAYLLPTTEQTDRRSIILYNVSDTDMFYGDSSVTTTNGILLASGAEVSLDISSGLYAVCGTAGKIINVLELK